VSRRSWLVLRVAVLGERSALRRAGALTLGRFDLARIAAQGRQLLWRRLVGPDGGEGRRIVEAEIELRALGRLGGLDRGLLGGHGQGNEEQEQGARHAGG